MAMKVQFENSRKEFCSDEFLDGIKPIEDKPIEEGQEEEGKDKDGKKKSGAAATKGKKQEKKKGLFGFLFKGK